MSDDTVQPPAVSATDHVRELASALAVPSGPTLTVIKGVVTAVDLSGNPATVAVQLNGDTTSSISGVRFLTSYSPEIDDTVQILKQGPDLLIVGQVQGTTTATAGGWNAPTLNSGYTPNGNSNGPIYYRLVMDNGAKKLQFKGSVAVSGSPGSVIFNLPAGFRPANKISVNVQRNPVDSNVAQLDINANGDVSCVGNNTTAQAATPGTSNVTFNLQHYHVGGGGSGNTSGVVSTAGVGGNVDGGNANWAHSHTVNSHQHTVSSPTWLGFNTVEVFLD